MAEKTKTQRGQDFNSCWGLEDDSTDRLFRGQCFVRAIVMGCAHVFQAALDQNCLSRCFGARFTLCNGFCTLGLFSVPLAAAASQHGAGDKQRAGQAAGRSPVLLLPSFVSGASSSFLSMINTVLFRVCHFSKFDLTGFTILAFFFIYEAVQEHSQLTTDHTGSFH